MQTLKILHFLNNWFAGDLQLAPRKRKIFCLYCQDVVPLHPEVTEKIGIIK